MEGVDVDTGTTFGAPLYLNTDGNYDACDASAIATMICSALYLASSKVLLLGSIREDDWNWTVGGKIYVSETTGELTQTAPSTASAIVQCVGIALTADSILFNPSMDWVEVA